MGFPVCMTGSEVVFLTHRGSFLLPPTQVFSLLKIFSCSPEIPTIANLDLLLRVYINNLVSILDESSGDSREVLLLLSVIVKI